VSKNLKGNGDQYDVFAVIGTDVFEQDPNAPELKDLEIDIPIGPIILQVSYLLDTSFGIPAVFCSQRHSLTAPWRP
jgi:hypothetical protein